MQLFVVVDISVGFLVNTFNKVFFCEIVFLLVKYVFANIFFVYEKIFCDFVFGFVDQGF